MDNLMHNRICYAPSDMSGGGEVNTDLINEVNDENPKGAPDKPETFADMWAKPKPADDANSGQSQQQQTQIQQQPAPFDEGKTLASYLRDAKVMDGIDFTQVAADITDGKPESLQAAFEKMGAGIYKTAILDADKIAKRHSSEAADSAVAKSGQQRVSQQAFDQLHSDLPFTTDPAIRPVARGVFGQMMKLNDGDATVSIEKTRKYLVRMHEISKKELGIKDPPSRPGGSPFNSGGDETVDFESMFSGEEV